MPFQKGCKSIGGRPKGSMNIRSLQWQGIVDWLQREGGYGYLEKLKRLDEGNKLTEPEKEFLEHYEKLLEYHQPKLGRNEQKIEVEEKKFLIF